MALGYVVSVIFYWLLVRWPDYQKRVRIKKSVAAHYKSFKLDCIEIFLVVSCPNCDRSDPDKLLDLHAFRDYFKREAGHGQTYWDAFANNLTADYLQDLITRMPEFRGEISFVLYNTDIGDERVMEFFKRFSSAIFSTKNATIDYDSIKKFCAFLWSLFTGWDWVEGYPERDVVNEMIAAI